MFYLQCDSFWFSNFHELIRFSWQIEGKDVGQIVKVRIGHDGTSFGDGWFLDKVSVIFDDGNL